MSMPVTISNVSNDRRAVVIQEEISASGEPRTMRYTIDPGKHETLHINSGRTLRIEEGEQVPQHEAAFEHK